MPRVKPHSHLCMDCREPVECAGVWEQNHDGLTTVFCAEYERYRDEWRCDACHDAYEAAQKAVCIYCGERPKREGSDYCCPACAIDAEGSERECHDGL